MSIDLVLSWYQAWSWLQEPCTHIKGHVSWQNIALAGLHQSVIYDCPAMEGKVHRYLYRRVILSERLCHDLTFVWFHHALILTLHHSSARMLKWRSVVSIEDTFDQDETGMGICLRHLSGNTVTLFFFWMIDILSAIGSINLFVLISFRFFIYFLWISWQASIFNSKWSHRHKPHSVHVVL